MSSSSSNLQQRVGISHRQLPPQVQARQLHPTTSQQTASTQFLSARSSSKHGRGISVRCLGWCWILGTTFAFMGAMIFLSSNGQQTASSSFHSDDRDMQGLLRRHLSLPVKPPPSIPQDKATVQSILEFLEHPHDDNLHDRIITQLQQDWKFPLVHIVNTRFMQEQGHLQALGRARLHLFRTFCLPTMVHQSTSDFLWIIKTDPQLDASLLHDLIEDLKPYPNIYLVASNRNFMIRDAHGAGHSWRDGAEIQNILESQIYTGNLTVLYQAMVQKDLQVVLESRLDADDGLHRDYLQTIQTKALQQFLGEGEDGQVRHHQLQGEEQTPPKWLYWCSRRHVEWHGGVQPKASLAINEKNLQISSLDEKDLDYHGTLLVVEHSRLCITPGITVGFGIGTDAEEVPIHAHDKLYKEIHALSVDKACGYKKVKHCLELVEDFLLVAVRARTPTSAGMQRVGTEDDDDQQHNDNIQNSTNASNNNQTQTKKNKKKPKKPKEPPMRKYLYWELLHDSFSVLREQVQYTNRYILNHLVPIAKDNLEGQCTSDHSCKSDTKEKLLKIIEGKR